MVRNEIAHYSLGAAWLIGAFVAAWLVTKLERECAEDRALNLCERYHPEVRDAA